MSWTPEAVHEVVQGSKAKPSKPCFFSKFALLDLETRSLSRKSVDQDVDRWSADGFIPVTRRETESVFCFFNTVVFPCLLHFGRMLLSSFLWHLWKGW